jgi:hypothetical protein
MGTEDSKKSKLNKIVVNRLNPKQAIQEDNEGEFLIYSFITMSNHYFQGVLWILLAATHIPAL